MMKRTWLSLSSTLALALFVVACGANETSLSSVADQRDHSIQPDPYATLVSAEISVPQDIMVSSDVIAVVTAVLPSSCYEVRLRVQDRDWRTHVIIPNLVIIGKSCPPFQDTERVRVNLGKLAPGVHSIMMDGAKQPCDANLFRVK
jgi:hypothetical protein